MATATAGTSSTTQPLAASFASFQSAIVHFQNATETRPYTYQFLPLQPVPQSELSTVSLDNFERILKGMWSTTSGNTSQMVELTATTDKDYAEAFNLFKLPGGTLHKIFRVQNATLFLQYMTEKRKMDQIYATQTASSVSHEHFLYHGTNRTNVDNINANGFDRSYSGAAHGTALGNGTYFARDIAYSAGYSTVDTSSGHKFLYVARVLVGRFCQGFSGMQHLPNQKTGIPFDCAVNVTTPSVFVIFRDIRAYPTYLYEFS